MKSKHSRVQVLSVLFLFCIAGWGWPLSANAAMPTDISGHWAHKHIESMVAQGVIAGYPDGSFRPDNPITRAEFVSMINRSFYFMQKGFIHYIDVAEGDWYYQELARAQMAGYIKGNPEGTFLPNREITRQEAAVMLAKALRLDTTAYTPLTFTDSKSIPEWSYNAIGAVVKYGCMSGLGDGSFQPTALCSKAQAAVMLDLAREKKAWVITQPGMYGPDSGMATIDSNAVIKAPGVILRNTTIQGCLIYGIGIREDQVTLRNVKVMGPVLHQ